MYPKDKKYTAIVHYMHFTRSLRGVSRVYGVGKSTLGRWVKAHAKNNGCEYTRTSRVPMHRMLSDKVGSILEQNPFFKGHQVVAELRSQGIKASEATVCRSRRAAGYSRKRVRACFRPRAPTVDGAKEYLAALEEAPEALAIDETCVYVEEAPRYGYTRKGHRCFYRRKQPPRSGKVTLLMAISERRGVVASMVVKGSINSASFASFIGSLDAAPGSVAILDNVSFHKSAVVRDAAARKGIKFLFIPPYSPDFNPIEGTFSVLKSALRSGQQIDMDTAMATITAEKCKAFFRKSKQAASLVGSSAG